MRYCKKCSIKLRSDNQYDYCKACRKTKPIKCIDCGKPIDVDHTRCKACYMIVLSNREKTGILNPNYKDGKSVVNRSWAEAVKERDNYTCQLCGQSREDVGQKNIHAHHKKSRIDYPELALKVSNGITLCNICHFKTERYAESLDLKLEIKRLKAELETVRG